jgi:hypothetical protein
MKLAALLIAILAFGASSARGAALHGLEVHVTGDMVTLGDLFDGAAETAGIEVAKAPPHALRFRRRQPPRLASAQHERPHHRFPRWRQPDRHPRG